MHTATYSASWDGLVKALTLAVVAPLLSVIGFLAVVAENPALTGLLMVLFGSVLFLLYLWSPRAYVLSMDSVIVKRVLSDVRIRIANEPKRWTWWGLGLWGSGGLWIFRNLRLQRNRQSANVRNEQAQHGAS